jgi:radical SAM/Cys-rich protein
MSSFNSDILKGKIEIVQINLGNLCNQECEHCHVAGSPIGENNMSRETADKIIGNLIDMDVKQVEFTGGAPEMNKNLPHFIEELCKNNKNKNITVRTNLTILDSPEYSFYYDLFKKYKVSLVASLPCYDKENVDVQRGTGVYNKSISVLKKLNELGYGKGELKLDLVYNPLGDFLPGDQTELENDYKANLKESAGIEFNSLITIANNPINRFKEKLVKENKFESYMKLLKDSYNEKNLDKLMCKRLISVDFEGNIYDCDFNQVLGMKINDTKFWDVDFSDFKPAIKVGEHCFACTAGAGSSCYGSLE